ncbi:glycosyltransferase family 39 protein [Candidatus Poribacteria bacterium]|nr:glycosyltransferase family 39 protein [Candidatus Poribacteria bacterium]
MPPQWSQAAGIKLFNNEWGVRLPAAVFGTLAVFIGTWWAFRRLGNTHALLVGSLLALSPFGVFYSQDATHYGPLLTLGVLAAIGVDLYANSRKWERALAVLLIALAAPALLSHPVSVFCLGGFAVLGCAWLWCHPGEIPVPGARPDVRRIVLLATIAIALSVALPRFFAAAEGRQYHPHIGPRKFGLNAPFLSATLADFFGATYHHRPLDVAAGVAGLVLSVAGWAMLARKKEFRWAVLGAAVMPFTVFGPFFAVKISQFFSPRYLTPLSPALIMGVGLCLAEVAARCRQSVPHRLAAAMCGGWLVLFLCRTGVFEARRFQYSVQPSVETLEWVRKETPPDAILFTRHRYSSKSARFLWNRMEMGDRQLVAVSYNRGHGTPAIQQIEETLAETGREGYFFSFIESEEHIASDFDEWLRTRTEVAALLPSSIADDFVPIDWSVTIRRVMPPDGDPFSLPRSGGRISSILGEDAAMPFIRVGVSTVGLGPGMGVSYRIRSNGEREPIQVRFSTGLSKSPSWLVTGWDQVPGRLFVIPSRTEGGFAISAGTPPSPGIHTLHLALTGDMAPDQPERWISVREIVRGVDSESELLEAADLHRVAGGGESTEWEAAWSSQPILTARWRVPKRPSGTRCIVVVQPVFARGTGAVALRGDVQIRGSAPVTFMPPLDWTFGENWSVGVLPWPAPGTVITAKLHAVAWRSYRPWLSRAAITPPIILTDGPSSDSRNSSPDSSSDSWYYGSFP